MVLQDADIDTFSGIKLFTEILPGIPSVCISAAKLYRQAEKVSFQGNIALKVNIQLNGSNQRFEIPLAQDRQTDYGRTILLGADVTHPGPGSVPHCSSIAAVVGSTDMWWSRYPGSVRLQGSRQEMIDDLEGMVRERLIAWSDANDGTLSDNILLYRDGVSESQFALVKQHELPRIHAACQKLVKERKLDLQIRVTHLIVDKRHNTRFYPH